MSSKRSWIVYLLAAISIAAVYVWTSSRDKFAEAEQHFARQDFVTAYLMYLDLAKEGDARAQYAVSRILDEGLGPNIYDADQALNWLARSARSGYGYAQLELGDLFYEGDRVVRDLIQAEKWWGGAADKNVHEALDKLDSLYPWDGDFSSARGGLWIQSENVARLTDLAEEGRPYAVVLMARFFAQGLGVEQDLAHAHELMEIAAANGNAAAHLFLGLELRDASEQQDGAAMARTHFETAANLGIGVAAFFMAESLWLGNGGSADMEGAYYWALIAEQDPNFDKINNDVLSDIFAAELGGERIAEIRAHANAWSPEGPPERIRAAQGMFH